MEGKRGGGSRGLRMLLRAAVGAQHGSNTNGAAAPGVSKVTAVLLRRCLARSCPRSPQNPPPTNPACPPHPFACSSLRMESASTAIQATIS